MGKSRRKHSREFKLEAVKQVVEYGRSVSEVADSLGLARNMLTRWKSQFLAAGALAFPGHGKQSELEEEPQRRNLLGHVQRDQGLVRPRG